MCVFYLNFLYLIYTYKMTNKNKHILIAYQKGYRVINGRVIYRMRERKLQINKGGYYNFSVKSDNKNVIIMVHRLAAYQKYGETIFNSEITVRHLDNNSKNNNNCNIGLGTLSENMQDKTLETRQRVSKAMVKAISKHNHIEIINYHSLNRSYAETTRKFNICNGLLSFILTKSLAAKSLKKDHE